jgi:predicted ribosome quality control (RQC) complex YloA/Tae2 family protein
MNLNWKEIDLVLSELPLEGAFIQKIRQPDFSSLVLDLYNPVEQKSFSFLIVLADGMSRIHAIDEKRENTVKLQRFCQILRSRIKGQRIRECAQVGAQRVVYLKTKDHILWIRLWGGAGNCLLTDAENKILDVFYRRPKRNEIAGAVYNPPDSKGNNEAGTKEFSVREFSEASFNQHLEKSYAHEEQISSRDQRKAKIQQEISKELSKLWTREKKLASIQQQDSTELQKKADLLMSIAHESHPGKTSILLQDFDQQHELEIELDPGISISANAQNYYRRTQRLEAQQQAQKDELENLQNRIQSLTRLQGKLNSEEDFSIEELQHLRSEHFIEKTKESKKTKQLAPGLQFHSGEWQILVGRNSKENDELLRTWVKGNDYWLHVRDYQGGYVFIKAHKNKSVPLEILLDAGNLAIWYSKAKGHDSADLYYTQVKYLRRAKGAKLGTVLPTQEKNLHVKVEAARIEKLRKL